jgi:transposase-like protein
MNGRIEIVAEPERRRRWSEEELHLIAKACRPGSSVSQVAGQRGINASQLFAWRRQAVAKALISDHRERRTVAALTFAPVVAADRRCSRGAHLGVEARMIALLSGARVWPATGHTDMRRGFP